MAKTTKRKSFIFNIEWQEVLLEYPAEVRLEVYDAIIEYVASGTLSELKPMARIAFSFIKREIDFNEQRYQEVVSKRSEAGKRSAELRNNKSTNLTNVNICQQVATNPTEYVYENEYVDDNVIEKENNSNELLKKKPQPQAVKRFVKPTISDVQAYCKERDNGVDAEKFCSYYEAIGWRVGKNPMKDWKAAVRTWERSTTSNKIQTQPPGVKLGKGEWITQDGRRTYGTGRANIPMDAPPRPSEQYSWSAETNKWMVL